MQKPCTSVLHKCKQCLTIDPEQGIKISIEKPDRSANRLVPSSVGRALGSHDAKYTTHITLFYQGKIAIIEVLKEIQMSIYPGKGGLICLLSMWLRKSAFAAALVGNLTCPKYFGWPQYNWCFNITTSSMSAIREKKVSFVNLKTKAVTPLSEACG